MRAMVLALALLAGCCVTVDAVAAGVPQTRKALRESAEATMRLGGQIVINPDGTVHSHTLDNPTRISPQLVDLVDRAVRRWRFEPVVLDGRAVQAMTRMSLQLVAKPVGEGNMSVSLAGAWFGSAFDARTRQTQAQRFIPVIARDRKPIQPSYPRDLMRAGIGGTVYAVARIGRDGKVEDAFIEQVNLDTGGNKSQMDAARKLLAQEVDRTVRGWKFLTPNAGSTVDAPYWTMRVPVSFHAGSRPMPQPGQWEMYLPGPRNSAPPWASAALALAGAPDALAGDGVYALEGVPRLLTPLEG